MKWCLRHPNIDICRCQIKRYERSFLHTLILNRVQIKKGTGIFLYLCHINPYFSNSCNMISRFTKKTALLLGLTVLCIFLPKESFGQDVRGYFFNGAYFYTNTSEPYSSDVATLECYLTGGNVREAEEFKMLDGFKKLKRTFSNVVSYGGWPEWKTISETVHELSYTKDAVYSISRTTTSALSRNGSTSRDKITLLAMPLEDGPRIWDEQEDGTKYSCKAEWVYVVDTYSFIDKVIKVSKTEKKSGTTECTYWAYNLGKIWGTVTTDKTRTVSRRSAFKEFKEISEEEYNKTKTISEFKEARKGVVKSYKVDKPEGYELLQDAFAKYVLTLNCDDIIYYAGKNEKSDDWTYWLGDGKDWPGFQLKYTFEVAVEDMHIQCTRSKDQTFQNGKEVFVRNEYPSDSYAEKALYNIVSNPSIRPPFDVEPTTNYQYYYDMKDNVEVTVDVCSYRFKIKKKKDSYEVTSGDMDVWNLCERSIQKELTKLLEEKSGRNVVVRIVKFSCGKNERYSLVTDFSIKGYRQEEIRCVLYNTDQKKYHNYYNEYNPNRPIF